MMRAQQALAFWWTEFLPPKLYDQIFSAHETLMIFFIVMPFVIGLMNFAFMPLYVLGFLRMTRRMQHYNVPAWHSWLLLAAVGAMVILAGIVCQIVQIVVSMRERDALQDKTGDPLDGRPLESATASPPPAFNFAYLPEVDGEQPYWGIKQQAHERARLGAEPAYEGIEMARNSPTCVVCALFSTFVGFALIWHIWWMADLGLAAAIGTFVVFAWRDEAGYVIPATKVREIDHVNRKARSEALTQLETVL